MGRFEKQPDNPRVRGDLSRSAETALWAVVEDLEHLQQNVLKSLQEEIKQLYAEKTRLADEIQRLIEEKEHLQQVRQITEQQVLIRQLAEALAKHISSQLQSSLTTLANQALERESSERSALKSAESGGNLVGQSSENLERQIDNLDDTLTIAFNSLQQELKNYQSDISQQLSRMYSQQQQGEALIEELTNHLRRELTKTIKETPREPIKSSPPTVLQPPEPERDDFSKTSPSAVEVVPPSPPTVLQPPEPKPDISLNQYPLLSEVTKRAEPTSAPSKNLAAIPPSSVQENPPAAIASTPKNLSESEIKSPPVKEKPIEPISVTAKKSSESETKSPPAKEKPIEPISVTAKKSSEGENKSSSQKNIAEPISVISRKSSRPPRVTKLEGTPSSRPSSSSGLSPVQIGFLLVVLSTVVSSLYNVALKEMFHKASEIPGLLEERLVAPTLGNVFLILTLRLMVVVPLMILLAPMMYPQVWQDLQKLVESARGNSAASGVKKQKTLQLSIASGCFLFLSQVLIYLAVGQIATGMAIALFFIYPLVSGLLSWFLFRDRPSPFRAAAIGAIFCGELLVLGGAVSTGIDNIPLAGTMAILAGVAFAGYVVLTRMCATQIHPVSFTLINFVTMLGLSFVFLMLPLPDNLSLAVDQSKLLEIVLSAFILGVLTLFGYVFNHIGIGKLGASRSAIIGAGVPILTVIFAGLMIQETLEFVQILGVLFVTFGAAAFSFEKMRNQVKSTSSEK